MGWSQTTLLSIDTETTGLDWHSDRILQIGASVFIGGKFQMGYEWTLNAHYPCSPEAIAVHGITPEKQSRGENPQTRLLQMAGWLNMMRQRNLPVIIMNAPFDLNFFISEWERWKIPYVLDGLYIIDPLVIDRFFSKNRIPAFARGARTLKALSERFGIHDYPLHSAGHDSRRVGELAIEMANRNGQISRAVPRELHRRQIRWHKQWCDGFDSFANARGFQFHRTEWPHRPISDDQMQLALEWAASQNDMHSKSPCS